MPPNILIFMSDHQRADSILPGHLAIMPNLEHFAAQGVSFSKAFCPSPHCCPSRATFFTGLYPSRHGVWNNICNEQALSRGLKPGLRLWSDDLRDAGYQLHFSGKWHVSVEESPMDRGWTEHFISSNRSTYHGWSWAQYRERAAVPEPAERSEGEILRPGYFPWQVYGTASGPDAHDEAVVAAGLETLSALANQPEPWCLYIGINAPHDPYRVEQKYLDLYDLENIPLPAAYADRMEDKPAIYRRLREQLFDQLSEREVREAVRHFLAFCSYIDEMFGRVLAGLDKTGQAEDTLVLFVSDHGDYCGEHGLFAKGIPCFQGAYHIPAVMRWPAGLREPGRVVDAFVSLADFGPTFLAAAGLAPERPFSGASLLPFLRTETPMAWRDALFTQSNGVELYYTQRSVMTREWKYTFNGFDQDELYDLGSDPYETRNLAMDAGFDDQKRALCARLWRFAYEEDDTAINPYITTGLAPWGPAEAFR